MIKLLLAFAFLLIPNVALSAGPYLLNADATSGSGLIQVSYSTADLKADFTFYDAVLSSVPGLSFAVTGNTTYFFEFYPVFQSTATATGVSFGIGSDAVPSIFAVQALLPIAPTSTNFRNGRALNSALTSATVDVINADIVGRVFGIIVTGNGATSIQLQACSELAGGKGVVRAGSMGILWSP